MKPKILITITVVILSLFSLLAIIWFIFSRDTDEVNEDGSELSYISLSCKSSFEQNGVQISSQGCPEDSDQDGFLDTEKYMVAATNTTDSVKYVEYFKSRSTGDRRYLEVPANSTQSFTMSFGNVRQYSTDEVDILKRDIIIWDELQLGSIVETSTESFSCPDGADVEDQDTTLKAERFGWEITYNCLYDFDIKDGFTFGGAKLSGTLNASGRRIAVYEIPDEIGSTMIYQDESGFGLEYPNMKDYEITLYISE
jgi:hypothetical protein